jgi:hypothetical protein
MLIASNTYGRAVTQFILNIKVRTGTRTKNTDDDHYLILKYK